MNKKNLIVTAFLLGVVFLFSGCAVAPMRRVHVGMPISEVRKKIGNPLHVIDSKTLSDGKVLEVWEYRAERLGEKRFWLYFTNGMLIKWERVDDTSMTKPTFKIEKPRTEE